MGRQSVEENGYHNANNLINSIVKTNPARDTAHPEWALKSGPNTGYTRFKNTFRKYSGAFCLWSFCGGASSGATTYSQQIWSFGSGQTWHYLYGIGAPYTTSGVIYASNS